MEAFRAARTQVLGVSVDSVHSHARWGNHLGGISFPLLSDFEPKGEVGRRYGLYLAREGIDDRATVLIDAAGVVRWRHSVSPSGMRDVSMLLQRCEALDREFQETAKGPPTRRPLPSGSELFVKSDCGPSDAARVALENLHLQAELPVVDITEANDQRARLVKLAGTGQAPCLKLGAELVHESSSITARLAQAVAPLPAPEPTTSQR